jgi:hypothetical protein
MHRFLQRHKESVIGMLSGFDRIRFRGSLRLLAHVGGMLSFLSHQGVLLKHFKEYACGVTEQVRLAAIKLAVQTGRPFRYLPSSTTSKEDLARSIAQEDHIEEGLIAVFRCVEPCRSYEVHRNRETKHLELHNCLMKCLHYYFYFQHPRMGLLHARLQSWFPFTLHVCINGREWLARQLSRAQISYEQRDNCLVWVKDVARAQRLFDQQLRTDWVRLLDGIARQVHPMRAKILARCPVEYYWSAEQSEWASDVLFRSPAALANHYPRWLLHGITNLGSRDVLRFLGRHVPASGFGRLAAEVKTDLRQRTEGTRLKHFVNQNSIKMYDKQGSVLRIETTINRPYDIKVYRPKEGDEDGDKQWRCLRQGVADMHRRAEVSQAANERYLDSLASVEQSVSLEQLTQPLCQPTTWKGRRVRGLQPLGKQDAALLQAVNRGEFVIHGFRNRDLRALLYSTARVTPAEVRRQSAAVTRKLRLLRAHHLIKKVPHTHRYQVTDEGRNVIAALLAARQANTTQLLQAA